MVTDWKFFVENLRFVVIRYVNTGIAGDFVGPPEGAGNWLSVATRVVCPVKSQIEIGEREELTESPAFSHEGAVALSGLARCFTATCHSDSEKSSNQRLFRSLTDWNLANILFLWNTFVNPNLCEECVSELNGVPPRDEVRTVSDLEILVELVPETLNRCPGSRF